MCPRFFSTSLCRERAGMPRLAVLAVLLALGAQASASTVNGIRVWSEADSTRVVLDLSEPVDHTLFTLSQPNRVVVDIKGGQLGPELKSLPGKSGLLDGIRAARRGDDDLRIVLDLNDTVRPRSFVAAPNNRLGDRLIIDLKRPGKVAAVKSRPTIADRPARDIVVAISPGHGGKDPGAIGRRKTREKDVVLAIGRKLAAKINAEPGMRAVLVRNSDERVALRDRMERARSAKADLFIAVHADAVDDKRAKGSSVYALSLKGASDEASRRLAEQHNAADLIGGVSLADKDRVLASVLLDLSQNAALSASMDIGAAVVRELGRVGRVHKRTVQQAGFAVLKSPDVPSILVETAFISNPDEERKLRNPKYQDQLASAILGGVRNYFYSNPPPDSYIARSKVRKPAEPLRHVIARGDTLSGIADRYRVSLASLRSTNRLSGDRIRIGQILTIPTGG